MPILIAHHHHHHHHPHHHGAAHRFLIAESPHGILAREALTLIKNTLD
jgi:hypothetical protein